MAIQHDFPFDPTNGHTLEQFLKIASPEAPADFEAFWKNNYDLAMEHKPYYFIEREIWSPDEKVRIFAVRAKTWDNLEISMWILRPENPKGAILIGHGYGNPSQPPEPDRDFTICMPCVRGLGRSQCREIPWLPPRHVIHGIASRETYILRGVISDLWLAATVMIDMFPDAANNLNYMGGSMGGGMGALMVPWDSRFKAAYLDVPTFGAKIRFDYPSTGSGDACRLYIQEHPEALDVLAYFDASASAKYLTVPTIVTPALFDPCVAPVGQFSVANSIPESCRTMFVRETGHFPPTEKDKELLARVEELRRELFLKKK